MIPTSAHPCQDADAHHDSAVLPGVVQTATFFPFKVTPVPVEGSGESAVFPLLTEASAASASAASKSAKHTVLLPQFSGAALGTSSESKPAAATAAPATLRDANRPADRAGRVTLEVFSGCCRLSKCLRQQGFDTLAVDVKEAQGTLSLSWTSCHTQAFPCFGTSFNQVRLPTFIWRRPAVPAAPLAAYLEGHHRSGPLRTLTACQV